jgi:hypothetical protein
MEAEAINKANKGRKFTAHQGRKFTAAITERANRIPFFI